MVNEPYGVFLTFQNSAGSAVRGVTTVLRNTVLGQYGTVKTTNSSGQVTFDVGETNSDYSNGDFIEVLSYKDGLYAVHRFSVDDTDGDEEETVTMKTITYATPGDISDFLSLNKMFKINPIENNPSIAAIARKIFEAEDEIDYKTGHAWRERFCSTTSGAETTANYEFYTPDLLHRHATGIPIYLKHRKIKQLDTDEGDELGIYDGSSYNDWLTDASITEGRGNNWWMDYEKGILWIRWEFLTRHTDKIRLKYRYGEDSVNRLVKKIAIRLVCIELAETDDRSVLLAGGDGKLSNESKINQWKQFVKDGLFELAELDVTSPDKQGWGG